MDYDPYTFILNCVRAEEERRGSTLALAFMMQEHDMYHLVHLIWHGRSVVSKDKDLFHLRLARYQKDVEWAPWNCILLTKDEADIHYRIEDPATVYSQHLIEKINLAHQIAKNHFKYASNASIKRIMVSLEYSNGVQRLKILSISRFSLMSRIFFQTVDYF